MRIAVGFPVDDELSVALVKPQATNIFYPDSGARFIRRFDKKFVVRDVHAVLSRSQCRGVDKQKGSCGFGLVVAIFVRVRINGIIALLDSFAGITRRQHGYGGIDGQVRLVVFDDRA